MMQQLALDLQKLPQIICWDEKRILADGWTLVCNCKGLPVEYPDCPGMGETIRLFRDLDIDPVKTATNFVRIRPTTWRLYAKGEIVHGYVERPILNF